MPPQIYPQQHQALLAARTSKRVSLRQLSDLTLIDHRKLGIVERGLSVDEIEKVAKALGCHVSELL